MRIFAAFAALLLMMGAAAATTMTTTLIGDGPARPLAAMLRTVATDAEALVVEAPLPASGWLFLTAMSGLAYLGRGRV